MADTPLDIASASGLPGGYHAPTEDERAERHRRWLAWIEEGDTFCSSCGSSRGGHFIHDWLQCSEIERLRAVVAAVEAALRTDVYVDGERFHEMRDQDLDAWMKRGHNAGKVAPWAQDIDRLLRQVRAVRAALLEDHR